MADRIRRVYVNGASQGHSQTNEMIADGKMYKIYINMYHEICVHVRSFCVCVFAVRCIKLTNCTLLLVSFFIPIIWPAAVSTLPLCTTAATTIAAYISYVHMNSLCRTTNIRIQHSEIYSKPNGKECREHE